MDPSKYTSFTQGKRHILKLDKSLNQEYKRILLALNKEYQLTAPSRSFVTNQLVRNITTGLYHDNLFQIINKTPIRIIRGDITDFFPSINRHRLYQQIEHDGILSEQQYNLIKQIIFDRSLSGIPLGIPISSALASIYIKDFDVQIKIILHPIFYFRYVDDFIIILNDWNLKSKHWYYQTINNELKQLDLTMSLRKYSDINVSETTKTSFDFLGYNFKIIPHAEGSKKKPVNTNGILEIRISKLKIRKLQTRIHKYTVELKYNFFNKQNQINPDNLYWIYYFRMKNLFRSVRTTNPKDSIKGSQYIGIFNSYPLINSKDCLTPIIKTALYEFNHLSIPLNSKQRSLLFNLLKPFQFTIQGKQSIETLKKEVNFDYYHVSNTQLIKMNKLVNASFSGSKMSKSLLIRNLFQTLYHWPYKKGKEGHSASEEETN